MVSHHEMRYTIAKKNAEQEFRSLRFERVAHEFNSSGGNVPTLGGLSLNIERGDFVTVVGPSGCGKSTLFNIAAGLLPPTAGKVVVNNRPLNSINPYVAYMSQHAALLDWRSVLQNVMLGQEFLSRRRADARAEAIRGLEQFKLSRFEQSSPWELSGGMKQRVALLRTYLTHRNLLLLDEPFGALDALTRLEMQQFLLDRWQEDRRTVLFITHDIDEALLLGNRVLVLSSRPARLESVIEVDFARPRDVGQLLGDKDFIHLKKKLLDLLRGNMSADNRDEQ